MSEHVKLIASFDTAGGYRSIGLRSFQVEGDAVAAVEVARAVFSRHGLGEPSQSTWTVRAVNAGPASFQVSAVACERAKDRHVTEAEAVRFGRGMLEALGIRIVPDEG